MTDASFVREVARIHSELIVDLMNRFFAAGYNISHLQHLFDTSGRSGGEEFLIVCASPSDAGKGYLPDTCREWEAATAPAEAAGIRVVHLRIGVVLATSGGALKRMLPPFKAGLGGRLGSGRQYMSWISIDDLIRGCRFLLENDQLKGPFNLVSPSPVRNLEFARTLGRTLGRPAILPLPGVIISLLMGEMGRELLLAGARILPRRLEQAGFEFLYPNLKRALVHLLG